MTHGGGGAAGAGGGHHGGGGGFAHHHGGGGGLNGHHHHHHHGGNPDLYGPIGSDLGGPIGTGGPGGRPARRSKAVRIVFLAVLLLMFVVIPLMNRH